MQVYRGMDIGTAKPTVAEQALVKHHLIDVVEPDQTFTVSRFVEMADGVIARSKKDARPLICVGGTPLYYKALFEGLFEGPPADEAVRARLREMSGEELHRRLSEVDPEAAGRIHANDTKRLVRALEVYELTGRPISSFQTEWEGAGVHRHAATWIGLSWEKETLNRRINARVKKMMEAGWLEETRGLLERYGELSQTAAEATGYQELIEHVRGRMGLEEAMERIKIGTRQLARKQMKWMRRWGWVKWVEGGRDLEDLVATTQSIWQTR